MQNFNGHIRVPLKVLWTGFDYFTYGCSNGLLRDWVVLLKGIVHPKITILSLFTQTQVVPNCVHFILLLNIKEDSLKTNSNLQLLVPIDFHSMEENIMGINGNQKLIGFLTTWMWLKNFRFLVNCPFNEEPLVDFLYRVLYAYLIDYSGRYGMYGIDSILKKHTVYELIQLDWRIAWCLFFFWVHGGKWPLIIIYEVVFLSVDWVQFVFQPGTMRSKETESNWDTV